MEFFFQTKPQERHFTSAGSGSLRLALRSSWRELGRGAEESREGAGKTAEDAGALGIRILEVGTNRQVVEGDRRCDWPVRLQRFFRRIDIQMSIDGDRELENRKLQFVER